MQRLRDFLPLGAVWLFASGIAVAGAAQSPFVTVKLDPQTHVNASENLSGRLIVAFSHSATTEPRAGIRFTGEQIFGRDVSDLKAGSQVSIGKDSLGYPVSSIAGLASGDYFVQALLIRYDEVTRSDGHRIRVPIRPMREDVTLQEGNLYSEVKKVHVEKGKPFAARLELTRVVDPPAAPADTEWLKTVRIKSEILSKFWGMPVYLGARILLPLGFAEHPQQRYPIAYLFNHGDQPFGFDPDPATGSSDWLGEGANVQTGYEFYRTWKSTDMPRFVVASVYEASPYWMEAYAVDSANNGPYGQALTQELMPYIEREFRAIGKPYARMVEGASTGGWESLSLQLHYPTYFGGAWVYNPDPISFRHWQLIDIYHDSNAHQAQVGRWQEKDRPYRRTVDGQVVATVKEMDQFERVMGSHGRGSSQLDIWFATYGPVGDDGYPVPLWDKQTGRIHPEVAQYMRDHGYDLTAYVDANWDELQAALRGKINIINGEMDNYYLNLAVYDFEEVIRRRGGDDFARLVYGRPRKGHNWHHKDFSQMLREMAAHIAKHAPAGEPDEWRSSAATNDSH